MAAILIVRRPSDRDICIVSFEFGYQGVLVAKNARRGLQLFHRFRPKLLLIDLRNGSELLRRVREEDPNAAIIIPTGGTKTTTGSRASENWTVDLGDLHRSVERVLGPPSRTVTPFRRTRRSYRRQPYDPSPAALLGYFDACGRAKGSLRGNCGVVGVSCDGPSPGDNDRTIQSVVRILRQNGFQLWMV